MLWGWRLCWACGAWKWRLRSNEMIIIVFSPDKMNSQFSFSSQRSSKRHEDSILNEYRRLNMDQESFYFSIDPISYSPLPRFLPAAIARRYSNCIYLENASFYEMFTFAIFQFIFRGPPQGRTYRLTKLKDLVCSNNFLNFANFTKGLILKGLKVMAESAEESNFPVAQVLMGSEKMPAFCECWKEMLFHLKSKHQEVGDINSSMIEVFTQFFQLDLKFYSRKGKQFLEEVVRGQTNNQNQHISILLICSNSEEDEYSAKEQSISQISSIYGNWSYYVLLPQRPNHQRPVDLPLSKKQSNRMFKGYKRDTITIDYPQLFAIDEEKSQIKSKINQHNCEALVGNARKVVIRGYELLQKMKAFTDKLQAK